MSEKHGYRRGTPQLERQREMHGWSFRDHTPEQVEAIKHYIETGEKLEAFPYRDHRKS